ncbi:MAG: sigma 54-interacting transcriptional regulator, partial [Pseudomonadota bacterium]
AKRPVKVDVRVISATNRDLAEEVKSNRFREDLFYRLNVFPIEVPPLRQRREDISALLDHFIKRYNAEERRDVRGVRPEVLEVLKAQDWPGNVRQLENTIFRAVVLAENTQLTAEDFPLLADAFEDAGVPADASSMVRDDSPTQDKDGRVAGPVSLFDDAGHLRSLTAIEKDLILLAINTYEGKMTEIARRLGMGRSTLYRKMREHDLEVKKAS